MKMPSAFSSFILDRTEVIGGYYENAACIFMVYACGTKGFMYFY
jgi:hypothetical protein